MDYGTIKSHLIRNLGKRDDIDDYINQWINNTYLDLITQGKFPELGKFAPIPCPALDATTIWTTEEGIPDHLMATGALFPVSLRDTTNDVPLKQRGIRWYDRYKSTTNAKPRVYAIYGGRYWLDPTPDGAYAIQERYRKKITIPKLEADDDVPVIGQEWHEALELGATYRGARSIGHPDAGKWLGDLKAFMVAHSEQHTEEEEDVDIGFSIKM